MMIKTKEAEINPDQFALVMVGEFGEFSH